MTQIPLACPNCHRLLIDRDPETKACPGDGLTFQRVDGIWRMLLPGRLDYFSAFLQDYETIRRSEGRGSRDKAYYARLPEWDLSGRLSHDWKIRAKSFKTFLQQVLIPLEKNLKRPLRILDLGAGNGWLSNRLALRGHDLAAIDLTMNDFDGLGCRRFYDSSFQSMQAEFDRLPLPDRSADLAIFNASLHYSVNLEETLKEALRVLEAAGVLVIVDSPLYHDSSSGAQMVAERRAEFLKRYGFASDHLASENYLTESRLEGIGNTLHLKWKVITPFYGLRWSLRPLLAHLRRRREPARFQVIVGTLVQNPLHS